MIQQEILYTLKVGNRHLYRQVAMIQDLVDEGSVVVAVAIMLHHQVLPRLKRREIIFHGKVINMVHQMILKGRTSLIIKFRF